MSTLGVIVGRFQVPELHAAHRKLIRYASTNFDDVLIVIGTAMVLSKTNPLPYTYVREIVKSGVLGCVNVHIGQIYDKPTNEEWSIVLDDKITTMFPNHEVTLLGGRDSFIDRYTGIYTARVLGPDIFGESYSSSGTKIRSTLSPNTYQDTASFYAGYIKAVQDRRDIINSTVDLTIYNENMDKLLLGRKKVDDGLRMPGGFINPGESAEDAAYRELEEETGITEDHLIKSSMYPFRKLVFIDTNIIKDWRFRDSTDTILTHLFIGKVHENNKAIKASDDLVSLEWHSKKSLRKSHIADAHRDIILAMPL